MSQRLLRNGVLICEAPANADKLSDTGLIPDSEYTYRLVTVDGHGYQSSGAEFITRTKGLVEAGPKTQGSDAREHTADENSAVDLTDSSPTSSPPEANIYHYTTQGGLLSITKALALWATRIQYFNDGHELELGLSMARQDLLKALKDAPSPEEARSAEMFLESIDQVRSVGKYVLSLSASGDSLSQWRAYCRVGDGFSLGFTRETIEAIVAAKNWRLVSCIYDTTEHHRRIRRVVDDALARARNDPRDVEAHAWWFAQRLADAALELKNPTFADEREIRVISPAISEDDEHVKYRTGKFTLCPYYEFRLAPNPDDLPLERVIVGPTPYPEISIQATAALLRRRRIYRAWVFQSRTSLRLW